MPITPGARSKAKNNPFQNNQGYTATLVAGVEAANAVPITGQVKDNRGRNMQGVVALDAWIASSNTTFALHGTGPNAGVTASVGQVITSVANKIFKVVTNATGGFTLSAGDSAAFTGYLVLRMPDGALQVSNVITLV